jgi:outer membrane receptor protein involved in Fe transport
VAEGVPASAYGTIITNPANQYNGLVGGNAHLQTETALTSSFGIGWTPSYIPNLRVQLDYYDIKIRGVIGSIGYSTIQSLCATTGDYCEGTPNNLFFRSAAPYYSLWLNEGYIEDLLQNIGELHQRGIDLDVGYAVSLGGLGKLSTAMVGTYVNKYEITPLTALPSTGYNCEGFYGFVCGVPTYKWRHTLRVSWATPWDGITLGASWRYLSAMTVDTLNTNPNTYAGDGAIANGVIPANGSHIASFSYLDLTASFRASQYLSFRVGVNNVFDKDPPVIGGSSGGSNGNTYPEFYDALGRYIFATATVQF